MTEFEGKILEVQSEPLRSREIQILQLNLGYRCNMACKHCHIDAGPFRNEVMEKDIIDESLNIAREYNIGTIDLTGGAPELNPSFKYLLKEAKKLKRHIIVRSNLTVFLEEGMEDMPEFYSEHNVDIVASLPHYTEDGVDRVRGDMVFQKSIEALGRLNILGYGQYADKKQLNLVYNPMGAFLPSSQRELEEQYKRELYSAFGIVFNRLFTFANMPIGRFKSFLVRSGNYDRYMESVKHAFNRDTLNGLMCRYLISVGWDGRLYDCDFNQILGLSVEKSCRTHIGDFHYSALAERKIVTGNHCFVCTAGQGST
jgi:radical SAM/Cys-rich protein